MTNYRDLNRGGTKTAEEEKPCKNNRALSNPINNHTLLRSLLLNIRLRTPLLRLPHIMLFLGLKLRIPITRNTRYGTSNRSLSTVRDTGPEVVELAFGFLFLACGVLLAAGLFETLDKKVSIMFCEGEVWVNREGKGKRERTNLRANQTTQRLLSRPNSLGPAPLGAVGIIFRDGT